MDLLPFTGSPDEVATLDRLWFIFSDELLYPQTNERGMSRLALFFASVGEPIGRAMLFQFRERLITVSMQRASLVSEAAFVHLRRR